VIDEQDPEVVADLQLRAYTAASRKGLSDAQFGDAIKAAATPRIIDKVPCRARCGRLTEWTEEAQDAFDTFNRKLSGEREAPLDKTRIAFCDNCRKLGATYAADRNRKQVDALAVLIRELKDEPPPNTQRERELVEAIKKAGHPDVEGLVQTVREKRAKQPTGKRTRGSELMR
jgi:hypothetical protein